MPSRKPIPLTVQRAGMPPSKKLLVAVTPEIRSALNTYCAANGIELSDLIRTTICEKIGQPELADNMRKRGRPKNAAESAKPAHKQAGRTLSPIPKILSWKEFRTRFSDEHLLSLADSTDLRFQTVLNAVESHLNPQLLTDLDSQSISQFAAALRSTNIEEATVASHLNHLRAALNWAVSLDLLSSGNMPRFPKVKRARKGQRRKPMKGRPVTDSEFDRIIAKVPSIAPAASVERWQWFLRGLWWSGLRLEEALDLHWDRLDKMRVDLDTEKFPMLRILAASEKGGKDRVYPIAPEFAAMLRTVPPGGRAGRVFPLLLRTNVKTRDRGQVSMTHASQLIIKIGTAAKVITHVNPRTGQEHFAGAHDFRRSFGSRWARRVLPQILQQMMRHESIETTLNYYVDLAADDTASDIWAAFGKAIPPSRPPIPSTTQDGPEVGSD